MTLPLWGPSYTSDEIESALDEQDDVDHQRFESFDELAAAVAARIAAGDVVASFQGAMEFGPRALGNRSILADPRDPGMRDRINELVKKREGFRPFAPAVTTEAAAEYFDITAGDEATYEHMLYVLPVRAAYRDQLLAITHVDGSARVQTVSKKDNPRFWALLDAYGQRTGMPVLLNTSFNVRGQPIVCTPTEAIDTFLMARLHALAMGNFLVVRKETS